MIDATILKFADIQGVRSLLQSLKNDGESSIDSAIAAVDELIQHGHAAMTDTVQRQTATGKVEICPVCHRGVVTYWPILSGQAGSPVYGCKRCQWSEVR